MAVLTLSADIPTECPPYNAEGSLAVHLRHESDCTKYYVCDWGQKIERLCPLRLKGNKEYRLYFNAELQVCDWPWNVTCQDVVDQFRCPRTGRTNIPHESICNLYYECTDGDKHVRRCGPEQGFDKRTKRCEYNSGCNHCRVYDDCISHGEGWKYQEKQHRDTYYICNEDLCSLLKYCPDGQEFNPASRKCEDQALANVACPAGVIAIPHEKNCAQYYDCSSGKKKLMTCPEEMTFNYTLGMCDFSDEPSACTAAKKYRECRDAKRRSPNRYVCEEYYDCENGGAIRATCTGKNEVFDYEKLECRDRTIARCFNEDTCENNERVPGEKWSSEEGCGHYYECVRGRKKEKTCPNNARFDEDQQECDEYSRCSTPSPIRDCRNGKHGEKWASSKGCHYYVECVDGTEKERRCEDGGWFNSVKSECYPDDGVHCKENCFNGKHGEKWASSRGCHYYVECVDGTEKERQCEDGGWFNSAKSECYPDDGVHCKKNCFNGKHGQKWSSSRGCDYYFECVDGFEKERRCDNGLWFSNVTQQCDTKDVVNCDLPEEECPVENCGGIIRYPHEKRCAQYYTCVNGKKRLDTCPKGLHYDPELKMCNYIRNVGCVDKVRFTECPSDRSNVKLRHECSCDKYYECKDGMKVLRQCPAGKEFDHVDEKCDEPEKVQCVPLNFQFDATVYDQKHEE